MQDESGIEPGTGVDQAVVGAAGGWSRQRAALAFTEMNVEVCVGNLRQVVEGRGQLAGLRIGVDPACELDHDSALRRLCDQVESQAGAEGVLLRGGKEHRAGDWPFHEGAFHRQFSDFGVVGTAGPRLRVKRLGRVLRRAAGAKARGNRGVDRHPLREVQDGLLHLRGGADAGDQPPPEGDVLQEPVLADVEAEVIATGRVGPVSGKPPPRIGVVGELVAAREVPICARVRFGRTGFLPGGGTEVE
jgi:hypothetical protein